MAAVINGVNVEHLADRIAHAVKTCPEGFTLTSDGEHADTGCAVGLKGFELRTQFLPSPELIFAWLLQVSQRYYETLDTVGVGGWRDERSGLFYLDVNRVVSNAAQARELAAEQEQLAFYDLDRAQVVYL